jgi:hypothetical protein
MYTIKTQSQTDIVTQNITQSIMTGTYEVSAYCPRCKTFETLWFNGGVMIHTRKFTQNGEQVYHDCNTEEPCRLFPYFMKKG